MEAKKLVGWNVRRVRVLKGTTLEELADRAAVGASYLAKLERGEINVGLQILDRIRKALGVKLAELTIEPAPGERPPRPLSAGRKPLKAHRQSRAK